MKPVIYADVLLFLNIIITFLLLLAAARLVRIAPTPLNYLFGSLLGGLSSLVMLLPEMGFFASAACKLIFSAAITGVAFRPKSFSAALKAGGYFFAVSFIFAGMMLFASSLPGIELVQYNNGTAYINFSFKALVGACVVCYLVTCILGRVTRHRSAGETVFSAQIFLGGRSVKTTALLDTGNTLCDPFSGESIMISDKTVLEPVLPENIKHYLQGENIGAIKLIPCKTVSSESLLPVFRADRVELKSKKTVCSIKNVQIAVSREKINRVIVPSELFENSERRNEIENIAK